MLGINSETIHKWQNIVNLTYLLNLLVLSEISSSLNVLPAHGTLSRLNHPSMLLHTLLAKSVSALLNPARLLTYLQTYWTHKQLQDFFKQGSFYKLMTEVCLLIGGEESRRQRRSYQHKRILFWLTRFPRLNHHCNQS